MAKVLFVDDQPNILKALTRVFEDERIEIFTACSAKAGLALLKEHNFDVIFSDIRMPEMDGIEFLSQSREIQPDSIRIVLSAFADREQILNAINRGFIWSYQVKPWDDHNLIITLKNALKVYEKNIENKRLAEELEKSYEQMSSYNDELENKIWERTKELHMREEALKMLLDNINSLAIKEKIESDLALLSEAEKAEICFKKKIEPGYINVEMWRHNKCIGYVALLNPAVDGPDKIQGYLPIVEILTSMIKVISKKDSILVTSTIS
jgi:response regulator RpfG family c-di-GMP phosphodiesterase